MRNFVPEWWEYQLDKSSKIKFYFLDRLKWTDYHFHSEWDFRWVPINDYIAKIAVRLRDSWVDTKFISQHWFGHMRPWGSWITDNHTVLITKNDSDVFVCINIFRDCLNYTITEFFEKALDSVGAELLDERSFISRKAFFFWNIILQLSQEHDIDRTTLTLLMQEVEVKLSDDMIYWKEFSWYKLYQLIMEDVLVAWLIIWYEDKQWNKYYNFFKSKLLKGS